MRQTAVQNHAEGADTGTPRLGERAVRFPLTVRTPRLARALRAVAQALAFNDLNGAERLVGALSQGHSLEISAESDGSGIAPALRTRAIALVLLDLARNDWRVTLDDGQVYVIAPAWHCGASGLSPDQVRQEKHRIRNSMMARVREQLERPTTRRFISEAEDPRFTEDGPRSIESLIADGHLLSQSLLAQGAEAIRPYIQAADGLAGIDAYSGLRLSDAFRYFRYFWSFPYGSTPGRSIPMLIRDAGQPGHPVCGLLAVASAVPRLTVRDSALGWTPAWLEAQVVALSANRDSFRTVLADLEYDLGRHPDELTGAGFWPDLAAALELGGKQPSEIASGLERLAKGAASQRLRRARERLLAAIAGEVEGAIRSIALADLGVDHDEALKNPVRAHQRLTATSVRARDQYLRSRKLSSHPTGFSRASSAIAAGKDYAELSRTPLFKKKRAGQAAKLFAAWADLLLLRTPSGWEQLRVYATDPSGRYTGGKAVSSCLRTALLTLQGRFLASQVADIVVCGAIPPYGPLLGGKLAALLALSREPAGLFYDRYHKSESEIASQMAGEPVVRPANLLALTTTSFFGVGSSQYERVRLTDSVKWRFAGFSRGHGTLHFSETTTQTLLGLFKKETGMTLHTSTFGEGPSERLRKVRDGMARLGLNSEELVQHGAPRQVFVGELLPGATRPGISAPTRPWRLAGPSVEETAGLWRSRWLAPRLVRMPGIITEVANFDRSGALLSNRLPKPALREGTDGEDP